MMRRTGFSLIEVLLSIVLLSGGLILIYQPLLASLSALDYVDHRVEANRLMSNRIWKTQEDADRLGKIAGASQSEVLLGKQTSYQYQIKNTALSQDKSLYRSDTMIRWSAGGRAKRIERAAYFLVPHAASE